MNSNGLSSVSGTTSPTVLLVEDLDDDVFFFKRALRRAGIEANLHVGLDGVQAVEYLSNTGRYADPALYPRPDIMFLDLKMPNMNGFEVLEWLAQHPVNPPFKVIILTGSEEPGDMARACSLGACAYIIKPPAPERLVELFRELPAPAAQLHSVATQVSGPVRVEP